MVALKKLLVATVGAAFVVGIDNSAQAALLVSDAGTNSIKEYDQTTGAFLGNFVPTDSGGLKEPEGLTFGPDGNLFVSSSGTNSVKEYNGNTGDFVRDFVSSGSNGLSSPFALTFGSNGNLFVGSSSPGSSNTVLEYSGQTGAFVSSSPPLVTAPSYSEPSSPRVTGLAEGQDGKLYISSSGTRVAETGLFYGSVLQYDPKTRTVGNPIASYPSSPIADPRNLIFGPDKKLYVSNAIDLSRQLGAPPVFKLDPNTGVANTVVPYIVPVNGSIPPASFLYTQGGLNFAPDGNLLLSSSYYDEGAPSIKKFDVQTGAFISDFIPAGSGGLSSPQYLTFTPVPEPATTLLEPLSCGVVLGACLVLKRQQKTHK